MLQELLHQRFGKLLAINKFSKNNRFYWKCLCDCGNVVYHDRYVLTNIARHCGCDKPKSYNNTSYEGISGSYWSQVRNNAKARKLDLKLSIKEAWEIFEKQQGKCALSGMSLILKKYVKVPRKKNSFNEYNASLDRINTNLGYFKENCQWIDKRINLMKTNMEEKDFLDWCKAVYNFKILNKFPNELYIPNIIPKRIRKNLVIVGEISGGYWSGIRSTSKRKNISFNLSREEAWELFLKQDRKCVFTGLLLNFVSNYRITTKHTASLDRIDYKQGYCVDNIQWTHKIINIMRNKFSVQEFIELCSKICLYKKYEKV